MVGAIDDRGRPVARKLSTSGTPTADMVWESAALLAARHPGVVEVVATRSDALDLTYTGTHSLATWAPRSAAETAAVAAALATTLADLHAVGIVHGRIDPTHVLVGSGGRPVLCGFSGATVGGRAAPPTSPVVDGFADQATAPDGPQDPSADVYGLGAVLAFLVRGGDRRRPLAGRRRVLALIGGAGDAIRRRSLLRVAKRAMAADRRQRPPARAVAAALHDLAPGAALAGPAVSPTLSLPPPAPSSGRGRHRASWATLGIAAAGVTALGWAAVTTARPATEPTGADPPAAAGPIVPAPDDIGPAPTTDVRVVGANIVEAGGDRFEVGLPGDQAVVGDWDCDGVVTVALLRPSTGEVFVFNSWAGPDDDVTVPPAARVPGATRAVTHDPDGDGCATILVEREDAAGVEVTG